MKKFSWKKALLMSTSLVLTAVLAIGGTLAYLQDEDSDVNVMTLGNVEIDQIEYERVVENGGWVSIGETDKYGYTPDKLREFTQDKPLYPAVFADGAIKWDDRNGSQNSSGDGSHQQSWGQIGASGSNQLFDDSVKNVIDKFVFVKNTGKNNAYVRTWFAFEQGEISADDFKNVIMTNSDKDHWSWETVDTDVVIEDAAGVENTYVVLCATYLGPKSNPNGILAPDAVSYPSLLQIYMKPEATNDQVDAIDGNKNGTYDVLVFSQAIQVDGFEDAETALDEGFGPEHPWKDNPVEWHGYVYNEEQLETALTNGGKIKIGTSFTVSKTHSVGADAEIVGGGYTLSRAEGFTGTMFTVGESVSLTLEDITLDGGAVWTGAEDSTLLRGTTNSGVTATGNLILAENNAAIILNDGAVLQNNDGVNAVNLGTRIGATLTINGGEIINNNSNAGAIWGGGHITLNSGKINGNSSTGIAGAIRMVGSCNLTITGGEISHNKAATDGGAIWGYGASTYTFTGGEMSGNESVGTGGAIYTGTYSVIKISGDFEMLDNKSANSGAIRLTDHTSLTMTGGKIAGNSQNGESNAFNTWNNSISITGGEISDNISYVGGLGLTVGEANISGVISYVLSTNHNTAYLAADFNGFTFTVDETNANFSNFNFKPTSGYTYTAGDEDKLVCLNEGYATYWDTATGTFRLKELSIEVETADELIAALSSGKSVILVDNITLAEQLTVEKSVNIDLNNKFLATLGLDLQNGGKMINGTIVSAGNTNLTPHLKVSGGTFEMNGVTVKVQHHLNANAYWSEATGMEVANATAVLTDCNIKISNNTKAQWVYSYGISVNTAQVTVNGGSIIAECVAGTAANGPTNPNAISSMGACTVTLNNVEVTATYYATTVNGHLNLNTTDSGIDDTDIVDNRGGSHTLNHIG